MWVWARVLAASSILKPMLSALLAVDAVLIGLNIGRRYLRSQGTELASYGSMLAIGDDHSLGEIFGYLKTSTIVLCLLVCYARSRMPVFAALATAYFLALLDDSLRGHESLGGPLAAALGLPSVGGLEPHDLGEFLAFAGLGVGLAALVLAGFLRSDAAARGCGLIFLALLTGLAFFAVGVDLIHAASGDLFRGFRFGMGLIEDGGEMMILSVACAVAVSMAMAYEASPRHV